ncbi:MAG: hypothetical protein ACOYO1_18990 [Bacteroidales bacterium]
MTDNPFEWIRENQIELDSRDKLLRAREYNLSLLVPEQNDRLEKLRRGYIVLGLVNDEIRKSEPITKDRFKQDFELLNKQFGLINKETKTKQEIYKAQKELEQYISAAMSLITDRWNMACDYKDLWKKERFNFREEELKLSVEYLELADLEAKMTHTDWVVRADKLFINHKKLIEEQKKRLHGEEEELKDLEFLFELREKLFKVAESSFYI